MAERGRGGARRSQNVGLDVVVSDSQGVAVVCDEAWLAPGTGTECRATGIAEYGQYANTGTVTGTPPGGLAPIVVQDASHYLGTRAGIAIEKWTNGVQAGAVPGVYLLAGEAVTWTYGIHNTGNVTLTGVTLVDSKVAEVTCAVADPITLGAGEAVDCEAYGRAVTGAYSNTATASGQPLVGEAVAAQDVGYYYGATLALALVKETNGQGATAPPGPYLDVGWPVTWTYRVTNGSNVPLEIEVVDDPEGRANCPQPTLAAEQSMTCTLKGTVILGQYEKGATVEGRPPGGLASITDVAVSHYFGFVSEPAIVVEKWTNGQDADQAPGPFLYEGDLVQWEYRVANAGNVALSEVAVVDDRLGAIDCVSDTLDVGQSMVCQAQGTAEAGPYANVATVTAGYLGTTVEDADASHYFGMVPGLVIEKRTNGQSADAPPGPYLVVGNPVAWTYEVWNSGNVTLMQVTVVDDEEAAVTCPKTGLAPEETMVCIASGTVASGPYENLGTVSGRLPTGKIITAGDPSHYFGIHPEISVRKLIYDPGRQDSVHAPEAPGPVLLEGQTVTWTYVITNSGDITLTEVGLVDDPQGAVECPESSLAPQETMTCVLAGVAERGQYANVGQVSGAYPAGGTVEASDASHYLGLAVTPALDVRKTINGVDVHQPPGPFLPVGATVEWEYQITNVGSNAPVEGIVLSDDQVGAIDCPETRLGEGRSMLCAADGVAVAGPYSNTATVTGMGQTVTGTVAVTDTDVSYYFGTALAIALTKLTNGVVTDEPPGLSLILGDPVTWTYVVWNAGNVPLSGLSVVDDSGTAGAPGDDEEVCAFSSLDPGKAQSCTWTGVAIEGPYTNVATATASYEGVAVMATDVGYYRGGRHRVYLPVVVRQGP